MLTPIKTAFESFKRELVETMERGTCSRCGERLAFAPSYVSIHSTEFGDLCAGEGRCDRFNIPYCEACEPVPLPQGCVHMELFSGDNARCDFCLQRSQPLRHYDAANIATAHMLSGDTFTDDGAWAACTECAALIDAKRWPEFVGRCVDAIVSNNFPPGASTESRDHVAGLVRERVETMVAVIFKEKESVQ
jgi:hypothetical protein